MNQTTKSHQRRSADPCQRWVCSHTVGIGLPKIAGWDVILKMKEENPEVKVVVASGYIEPELKSEMYRAGVKDFVYKPYTLDHVVETLQTLIENP